MTQPISLADTLAYEILDQRRAPTELCGKRCDDGCHGDIACLRTAHPHDPDADMGPNKPPGNIAPHLAYNPDGSIIQWTCLPGDHDGLTVETRQERRTAAEAEERRTRTRELFDTLDPDYLKDLLRARGDLP